MDIATVQQLVAEGQIRKAIQLLKKGISSKNQAYLNQILVLESRLYDLESNLRKGILSRELASLEENRIAYSILEISEKLNTREFEEKYNNTEAISGRLNKVSTSIALISLIISLVVLIFGNNILVNFFKNKEQIHNLNANSELIVKNKIEETLQNLDSTFYKNDFFSDINHQELKFNLLVLDDKLLKRDDLLEFTGNAILLNEDNNKNYVYKISGLLENNIALNSLRLIHNKEEKSILIEKKYLKK